MEIFKTIAFILGVLALLLIPVLWIRAILLRNRKNTKESTSELMYETIVGGRFDGRNCSYPFVRLSIYPDFLVIKHKKEIMIEFSQITNVMKINFFIFSGVRIIHKANNTPKSILLWTSKEKMIKSHINIKSKS